MSQILANSSGLFTLCVHFLLCLKIFSEILHGFCAPLGDGGKLYFYKQYYAARRQQPEEHVPETPSLQNVLSTIERTAAVSPTVKLLSASEQVFRLSHAPLRFDCLLSRPTSLIVINHQGKGRTCNTILCCVPASCTCDLTAYVMSHI
jgi:hypothetical protein